MLKAHVVGTHRARSPADTLAYVAPHLARFGITRIANVSGLDPIGLPVVAVCRPNARSSAVFHGKGLDLAAAKASGVMEAIETWHAEEMQPPLRFGSIDDLGSRLTLVDCGGLPRTSAPPLSDDQPLLWVEGLDLRSGLSTWVPFEVVHTRFTIDGPPASGCFAMNTNGLASGNVYLEAVSHALCEVIERDATSLWKATPHVMQDAKRLALDTVADPACRSVLDRFTRAGIAVGVWDVTTDIGVPVFQCVIRDAAAQTRHIGNGAGCHPSRPIALLRALTEAAQVRMTYTVGSREDLNQDDYTAATLRDRNRAAARMIDRAEAAQDFEAGPTFTFETFDDEVGWLVERLAATGLSQAIAVDLSRDDLELAVVRVVVPGLEGSDHHPGFVPGRRRLRMQEASR